MVNEISWFLEVLKIGIPVATTIVVGLSIARSNEKYKTLLAREQYRYQDYYPRMTATVADLYRQFALVERALSLANSIATNDLYKDAAEIRDEQFSVQATEALRLTIQLDETYACVKILLDVESVEIFDAIVS